MDFSVLPSGLNIQMTLTDHDTTAYAEKYINEHKEDIKNLIRQKTMINADISQPVIRFKPDEIDISARIGIKFVKTNAEVIAAVNWDGSNVNVNIKELILPLVSLDASKANGLIREPIEKFVGMLKQDFTILSFRVETGNITINAVKK